jgi:hypothetical protein
VLFILSIVYAECLVFIVMMSATMVNVVAPLSVFRPHERHYFLDAVKMQK